ncbi:MAG: protein kinase domain-containing protein [Terriglobia bacterium]
MSFQVGDTVGDYQIIGLLGAGGMGKVYKVKNQISDRVDALKVLLPDLAEDQGLADRFMREIKVLASLNHPNIAGLRTAFRLENQLLMVMEYVEGTNLEERAQAGPIPLADSIDYIRQALAALGYAHKHGVIHRDIKPANMMLTPDNVIKLMDFGIAKSKTERKLTQTGTTMGSLYYMSAEQVQGNELDGRSDLYSLGVSLYELVTRSRPFQGKSDFDIMVAQLKQTPLPPIQVMPDLPRALNDIIMISLEKDPAKRFQTAEAFSAALGSITTGLNATPMQAVGGAIGGISAEQASATGMVSSPGGVAPAGYTQPMPVGGPLAPSGGYIPTGPQPAVMAQPPQPSGAARPPVAAQSAPAPSGSKGYRGLYMTLGALIALAIIVVGATQIPRFLKTHASGDQTAQMTSPATPNAGAPNSPTSTTPSGPGANPTVGVADGGNAPSTVGGAGASPNPNSGVPATQNPANPGGSMMRAAKKSSPPNQVSASNLAAGGEQTPSAPDVPAPPAGGQVAPTAAPAGNNAETAQEMEELGDLHTKLAVRAQAMNDSVESLRKQVGSTGGNLRADVSASQTRMKMNMDRFDAAMNAGDPVTAKKYMALAEHEVEFLEKFFGQ